MTTITKEQADNALSDLLNDALCYRDGFGEARVNEKTVDSYIAQLEERVKVLEETLRPFSNAASKYRDIGDSPVAAYIKQRTGLLAGYCTVFVKLCSDSTSPKNWFDAADALAGGKDGVA